AQMNGDAVGPGQLGEGGGPHRVGLAAPPGLAKGGDVVDVHSEADHGARLQRGPRPVGRAAARSGPMGTDPSRPPPGPTGDGRPLAVHSTPIDPQAPFTGRSGALESTNVRSPPTAKATRPLRFGPAPSMAVILPSPYCGCSTRTPGR